MITKDESLQLLGRKLDVINEGEWRDTIDKYRMHTEMKMEERKSEKEAIEGFRNIDGLVDDILDAYKINTDRVNHSFDTRLNRFTGDLLNGSQWFLGSSTSLQVDDVVHLMFEILVILILLVALHTPFRMIPSLGSNLLHSVAGFGIGNLLAAIQKFIIGAVYVVIFVAVLVNLCTKRLDRYHSHSRNGGGPVYLMISRKTLILIR